MFKNRLILTLLVVGISIPGYAATRVGEGTVSAVGQHEELVLDHVPEVEWKESAREVLDLDAADHVVREATHVFLEDHLFLKPSANLVFELLLIFVVGLPSLDRGLPARDGSVVPGTDCSGTGTLGFTPT